MIKVYISSPYTIGDVAVNVKTQIDMVDVLMDHGFAPFAPLYSHFQHMVHPRSYEDWMKIDLAWVESCDCILRLPGESKGADIEVEHAKKLGVLVFYSLNELLKYFTDTQKKLLKQTHYKLAVCRNNNGIFKKWWNIFTR